MKTIQKGAIQGKSASKRKVVKLLYRVDVGWKCNKSESAHAHKNRRSKSFIRFQICISSTKKEIQRNAKEKGGEEKVNKIHCDDSIGMQ